MIFQVDYEQIEMLLWVFVSIAIALYTILFIYRAFKKDKSARFFNLAAAAIFFSLFFDSFKRIFFQGNIIAIFVANVALVLAMIPMVYYLEKNIIGRTKKILTLLAFIFVMIFIAGAMYFNFEQSIMNLLIMLPLAIEILVIGCSYIYLMVKGAGVLRKASAIIFFGLLIALGFWVIHGQIGRSSPQPMLEFVDLIGILAPSGVIIGFGIAAPGFTMV